MVRYQDRSDGITIQRLTEDNKRLTRERDEARALVERQAEEVRAVNLGAEDMRRKLDALRVENTRLREALESIPTTRLSMLTRSAALDG